MKTMFQLESQHRKFREAVRFGERFDERHNIDLLVHRFPGDNIVARVTRTIESVIERGNALETHPVY